jgi:hypothetical protein
MGDARRACFAWAWIFFAVSVSISPFIALIFHRLYNFCPRTEVFNLIEWTESKGRLDELFNSFCKENPGHPIRTQIYPYFSNYYVQAEVSPLRPPQEEVKPESSQAFLESESYRDAISAASPPSLYLEKTYQEDKLIHDTSQQIIEDVLREWPWTLSLIANYTSIGLVLALSQTPASVWVLAFAGSTASILSAIVISLLAWSGRLTKTLGLFRTVIWISSLILGSAWTGALVFTWNKAVAIDKIEYDESSGIAMMFVMFVFCTWLGSFSELEAIHTQKNRVTIVLGSLACLSLGLGVLIAIPFNITIPADWSHLPTWLR